MDTDEFSYENILRAKKGLLDIKIKLSVRDSECLGMVYTPGVATPCLDIQKDITRAYEFTNKGNAIIVLTDSSAICTEKVPNAKWNNDAAMPYLEAFSAYYKNISSIHPRAKFDLMQRPWLRLLMRFLLLMQVLNYSW